MKKILAGLIVFIVTSMPVSSFAVCELTGLGLLAGSPLLLSFRAEGGCYRDDTTDVGLFFSSEVGNQGSILGIGLGRRRCRDDCNGYTIGPVIMHTATVSRFAVDDAKYYGVEVKVNFSELYFVKSGVYRQSSSNQIGAAGEFSKHQFTGLSLGFGI